jgi:exodeoxyribonuclease III
MSDTNNQTESNFYFAKTLYFADIEVLIRANNFITGDFNEPSFRDWTVASAAAKRHPVPVAFPTTRRIESWGFTDTYRAIFADEEAKPAFTWIPTSETTTTDDHHDRIDFLFAKAKALKVDSAAIVGDKSPQGDLVVTPWPSDHRATMATVKF